MKKVLVILLACLTSTVMFGQTTHWTINKTGVSSKKGLLKCTLSIDGEQIYNGPDGQTSGGGQIELGVFDQDGVCRDARFPVWRSKPTATPPQYQWIYMGQIWGDNGFTYTFKLYDHASETELDYEFAMEPIEYDELTATNSGVGSVSNPFILEFVSPTTEGITLPIDTYTETKDNYYLIASPVGEVDASLVDNMTEYNYDLYTFDQNPDDGKEWINHRGEEAYLLQPCVGYLYANDGGGELDTIILSFPGSAFATADTTITLAYNSDAEFAGWNLVGNPYNATAYIGATRSFYRMNEDRTDLMSTTGGINPMEGVFVVATSAEDQITFTTEAPDVVPSLALNLSRNSKVIDRAVVNFNGERTLPKFQLNPNHTKVYIPQDNVDYAVVSAGEMGEMPVSFKAEKNGSYSMTFTAQEVNFAYLHLIDNKTGKDVDLLETPSYSFDAQTSDYTSRFKLVFATGNSTEDNFAFCSNGNWIINNDGEATLQVVDVNGRIMSEETISGCVSKSISAAPGVYMLRLINGDNVKVQKIIVK